MNVVNLSMIRPEEAALVERRVQFFNGHLTQVVWGLGAGAAFSGSPELFAWVFALLVIAMVAAFDWPHRRIYKLWREVKHPLTRPRIMWSRYIQFMLAWAFLGSVACGFVTGQGIKIALAASGA
jgi:hypothetical protein